MSLFLLIYLAIYGGAHAYLMTRTVRSFHLTAPYPALFVLVALFMVLAPVLVRVLEHHGMESPARGVGYLGYLWMGFFFLYLSASLAFDLLRALIAALGWMSHRDLWFGDQRLLTCSICVALAASLYGMLFEARNIRVEHVTLQTAKLPQSAGRVRVVQLSDVHLGLMVGRPRLKMILEQVSALAPDLLISTGDLLDGQMDGLRGLDAELASITPRLGKYAVLGNHEVFAGVLPSSRFTTAAGFHLLRRESAPVGEFLTVAGVDDPAARRGEKGGEGSEIMLGSLPTARYTILLKHRPSIDAGSLGLFDLQLSGHVHQGQIFPFNLITRLVYPAKTGLSDVGSGSLLYVSRGTGTWGPPMRLLAPPEITVIDLVPASV
jgi:uncharacterized protein